MEYIKFTDIHPAEYNPRKLSQEAFVSLQGSLKTLGFILPIIVNKDTNTIVAGHQRTKAATAVGIDQAPVYYVKNVNLEAEIRFNQLHNGVELEPKSLNTCLNPREWGTFHDDVPASDFKVEYCNPHVTKDICRMINLHGDAFCVIVCGQDVVFGNNYLKAASVLRIPVHCYFLDPAKRKMFDYYFAQDYGVFNYEHIERADFVQGRAQPNRYEGMDWSVLYRDVMLRLGKEDKKSIKVFDFGCGKGDFINKLHRQLGYRKALGLEFFNHNQVGISVERGQEMIDDFVRFVKRNGFEKGGVFDYTICDAVVNSVNCQKAEDAVFTCLNLFTKVGGRVYASGRRKEDVLNMLQQKRVSRDSTDSVKFFDENGLTAIMREGQWFFQKFLTDEQVEAVFSKFGLQRVRKHNTGNYWFFEAIKVKELPREQYIEAVDYEFNLKLPNNQSYNRQEEIKALFGLTDPKK